MLLIIDVNWAPQIGPHKTINANTTQIQLGNLNDTTMSLYIWMPQMHHIDSVHSNRLPYAMTHT